MHDILDGIRIVSVSINKGPSIVFQKEIQHSFNTKIRQYFPPIL